jgi:hypothetical protein
MDKDTHRPILGKEKKLDCSVEMRSRTICSRPDGGTNQQTSTCRTTYNRPVV